MMAGERETIKSGFFRGGSAPVKIMHTGLNRENGQSKKGGRKSPLLSYLGF